MASVQLKNVVKTYGKGQEPTIKGVDLTIHDGEFFILLGPSGCGKSTLLRTIAGLEDLTSGEVHIGDRRVDTLPPKARDIAMVFQSYALYPHMTVRENLAFGLKMRKTPKAEIDRRITETAETLGLDELLDRLPKALSGGQRQRVALGRAIVREPQAFLLDEPLSNLDAKLRGAMRTELKRLHRRLGVTMIYVTHDQVEAMTLGDRVAVMHEGRFQQIGAPLEVYDAPVNRFVAGFLGSPTMNFMRATIASGEAVLEDGLRLSLPPALAEAAPAGAEVELGIRPEDMAAHASGQGIHGTVAVVEPLGAETLLTVDTIHGALVARVAPELLPRCGAEVVLRPANDRLHLFDRVSGERVGPPPTRAAAKLEPVLAGASA